MQDKQTNTDKSTGLQRLKWKSGLTRKSVSPLFRYKDFPKVFMV